MITLRVHETGKSLGTLSDPDVRVLRQALESTSSSPKEYFLDAPTLEWLAEQGGPAAMGERNAQKAQRLYDAIDASAFYSNPVEKSARSRMNVPFILADSGLDKDFLAEATRAGLANLKGHRSVGGMRASLYNAMPEAGVAALIDFMRDFERRHG